MKPYNYLVLRLAVAVQKGNAATILGTVSSRTSTEGKAFRVVLLLSRFHTEGGRRPGIPPA